MGYFFYSRSYSRYEFYLLFVFAAINSSISKSTDTTTS